MITEILLLLACIPMASTYTAMDTVLEKKCNFLRRNLRAGFTDNSCFVATGDKFNTTHEDWVYLHDKCKHIEGYNGRMAFIRTTSQIQALQNQQVLEDNGRYFIGAKQDPPFECYTISCSSAEHLINWFYIDRNNQKHGKLNDELWHQSQPDVMQHSEHIVALEQLDSNTFLFNDVPGDADFEILCEYPNIITCADDYTLIGNKCYRVRSGTDYAGNRAGNGQKECALDGGRLATIHNDKQNTLLAVFARKFWKNRPDGRGPAGYDKWMSHGPVQFGMTFDDKWKNMDNSSVDYFRWFYVNTDGSEGHPNQIYQPKQYKHTVLFANTNGNDGVASFGYWANIYTDNDMVPAFLCETDPKVV